MRHWSTKVADGYSPLLGESWEHNRESDQVAKGSRRLLRACYEQVSQQTRIAPLAHRALELGLGHDSTAGHVHHAFGGAQEFFKKYPLHKQTVANAPIQPFQLTGQMQRDWVALLQRRRGEFGPHHYRYDWDKLRRLLKPSYGGIRRGGGGGNNELEIVLRLTATLF